MGIFLIAVLGTVFFIQVLLRYILTYKLSESSVDIVLLNILPIFRIRFDNIVRAEECSPFSPEALDPLIWPLGNRLWGKCVLIVKRKGFRQRILLTPDNPKVFIEQILLKIPANSDVLT